MGKIDLSPTIKATGLTINSYLIGYYVVSLNLGIKIPFWVYVITVMCFSPLFIQEKFTIGW